MKISFLLLVIVLFASCRNSPSDNTSKESEQQNTIEQLTPEQTTFIQYWSEHFNTKHAPILNLFRSRHINKTDLKQLEHYVKGKDSVTDFSDAIDFLSSKTELGIDSLLTQNIRWVKDNDVSICNKVDPGFWDCFSRRYPIDGFYYLSMPLYSADKQWCLISVNYLSKQKTNSFGGGRLYHLQHNKWEETAFLSYWGKEPE
jgi:hypothetical protein